MSSQTNQDQKISQLIVFSICNEEYAIEVGQIHEIVKHTSYSLIPNSPSYILGMSNLRGEVVVLVNLKDLFHLKQSDDHEGQYILTTEHQKNLLGLLVDDVVEVLHLQDGCQLLSPPTGEMSHNYLSGLFNIDGRLMGLIDLEEIIKNTVG